MAALTTALIVGSAIAAGSQIAGAAIQSHAAGNAADTQAAAGREALTLQRDMYRQGRSDLAPYMSAGAGAQGVLADVMGVPMAPVPDVQSSGPGGGTMGPDGRLRPPNSPTLGQAMRRPGTTSPTSDLPPRPGYQGDVWDADTNTTRNTGYAGGGQGERTAPNASGYVSMRAPDGAVAQVPTAQVETAMRRGAVRV